MAGPQYNLGGFSGQLTAEELARAYAAAGGQPADLAPMPAPAAPVAQDMGVQRALGRPAQQLDTYLQGDLADQNAKIALAGQSGEGAAAAHAAAASMRQQQADTQRGFNEQARADAANDRKRSAAKQEEADKLLADMRANLTPPDTSAGEKVWGVLGGLLAMGSHGRATQGVQLISSMVGSNRKERWAQEQAARSQLYQAVTRGIDLDNATEEQRHEVARRMGAADALYWDSAIEAEKQRGMGEAARREAEGLQLELRQKARGLLRADAERQKKEDEAARAAAKKNALNAREKWFWSQDLETLNQLPNSVLGEDGQKVREQMRKGDQAWRGGEADIAKKNAEAGGGAGQEILPGVVASVPLEKKDVSDIRSNAMALAKIKQNYRDLAAIRERHKGRAFSAWTDPDDVTTASNIISELTGTLNQMAGRGAPSEGERQDMIRQLQDPTDTYLLGEPGKVYENQVRRLENGFNAALGAVGAVRPDGTPVQAAPSSATGDPRVRRGFAAPQRQAPQSDAAVLQQLQSQSATQEAADAEAARRQSEQSAAMANALAGMVRR